MTERSMTHSTFTIEREYAVSPDKVFAAFASKEQKAKWFGDPAFPPTTWDFDFREGGRELEAGNFHGKHSQFEAIYHDIVENERIVFSYTMHFGGEKLSASLQSIELRPLASGTLLVLTEHGAYFDGHDIPTGREEGTRGLLDQLATSLEA